MLDEAIREAQSTPENERPEATFPMSVLGCPHAVARQQSAALQEEALQMVEKLLALTDQFSPALVQARVSAPHLATKTARSSLWKKLSLYGITDCFGLRSIRDSISSARMSDTKDFCVL
jgi:hypothetical protein